MVSVPDSMCKIGLGTRLLRTYLTSNCNLSDLRWTPKHTRNVSKSFWRKLAMASLWDPSLLPPPDSNNKYYLCTYVTVFIVLSICSVISFVSKRHVNPHGPDLERCGLGALE